MKCSIRIKILFPVNAITATSISCGISCSVEATRIALQVMYCECCERLQASQNITELFVDFFCFVFVCSIINFCILRLSGAVHFSLEDFNFLWGFFFPLFVSFFCLFIAVCRSLLLLCLLALFKNSLLSTILCLPEIIQMVCINDMAGHEEPFRL